ncbi:MAG: hypothetical protein ACRDIB_07730 [Ardenticatenaceae bacterium]
MGVRGCWELILKAIIALILIAIFIANWLSQGELNLTALILLLILLALLIALIYRQKHLVFLNCNLTEPTGCKHGDPNLLAGRVLERIEGTASGLGFAHYELEVVYGTTSIPAAVVYADNSGNPDTAATQGNFQVNSGTLGFVDIQQAVLGAGAGFLTSTTFEVRLHVVGIDSSRDSCTITFDIAAARSFIKKVGAAWSHDFINADEVLCRIPPPTVPSPGPHAIDPASVGGSIYVRGAANVYTCAAEKIAEVHLWAIPDPGFTFAQPANGSPSVVPAGGVQISEVIYTTDPQRDNNRLDGVSSEGSILTYAPGWTTRQECIYFDLGLQICWDVPDIVEIGWPTGPSGKYTLLLEVKDTLGNTYFDIQRVWVDNDNATAQITSIGGLAPCVDLKLSDYVGATAEIRGIAWDVPIVAAEPQAAPNENYDSYGLSFQKNGGAGGPIPPAISATTRVPNVWPGPLPPLTDGTLANWDIVNALDGASLTPTPGILAAAKLARGERCAYVITLGVSDTTLVGEGPTDHDASHLYAINIINDIT